MLAFTLNYLHIDYVFLDEFQQGVLKQTLFRTFAGEVFLDFFCSFFYLQKEVYLCRLYAAPNAQFALSH